MKAPASSFLMSVVIAGHTLHTAKNLHPSYHSQLHSCSIPSRRWNKPRWRLQMQSCNDPGVCSNGWARNEYCAYIVENVLPSHHSQFYSCSLPCSMEPILCSVSVAPHSGRWNGMSVESGKWHAAFRMWHVACDILTGECGMWNVT